MRNYLQVKQFLETNFPQLVGNINGGNRAPPLLITYLQNAITVLHMITIGCVLMGDRIWSVIGVRQIPNWFQSAKQYPMQTFVLIFVIVPSIINSYAVSGAFEIMLNGNVLTSRIESGQFPNGQELLNVFTNAGLTPRR